MKQNTQNRTNITISIHKHTTIYTRTMIQNRTIYGLPFFPIECLLAPSPNLLLIFQPSQSRVSSSLLSFGLLSCIFLTVLPWSILTTCSICSNFFFLIFVITFKSLPSSLYFWLFLILRIPYSTTVPYILISIFLTHVLSLFISISVTVHVPPVCYSTDLVMVLDLNICLKL